jgi:hypothetical protein
MRAATTPRPHTPSGRAQGQFYIYIKGTGKVHPITGHEGPEEEERYSSTSSLTSALDGGGGGG